MTPETALSAAHSPCARRCIRRGTETNDQPALLPATHGNYCARCHGRITRALHTLPDLVEHIISTNEPRLTAQPKEIQVQTTALTQSSAPFNEHAFDDANDIYRSLVQQTVTLATALAIHPPTPARKAWRNTQNTIQGLPANTTPQTAHYETGVMSAWIIIHLDTILTLDPDTIDYLTDETTALAAKSAAWPREMRARYSDMPHYQLAICGGQIAIYPPQPSDEIPHIVCEKCGTPFSDDEYDELVSTYLHDLAKAEGIKIAAHLWTKYGTSGLSGGE
ncbi:hypothetical protein GCM10022198_00390 [Klugiella xanthotipulae]|uniref:Uncharacterized protein n=1 Tax=Klugiella xanthotipulae TaxID=244735 RepID=A0A543I5D6_9MICO|nr:hypothetical protein [Klugiella xanthotipulae]TQM65823.1 hypothetical protein FB466_0636 [Klugiella xanthotipulae]